MPNAEIDAIFAAHTAAPPAEAPAAPAPSAESPAPPASSPGPSSPSPDGAPARVEARSISDAAPPNAAPAEPPVEQRLLALMEAERSLRERDEAVRKREEAAARALSEADQRVSSAERYRRLEEAVLSKDATAIAEALETDPFELAKRLQEGAPADPTKLLERRLTEDFSRKQAELQKALDDLRRAQEAQQMDAARTEILAAVRQQSPLLASLAALNPALPDAVIERARTLYQETGRAPGVEEVIPSLQKEASDEAMKIMEATLPHLDEAAKQRIRALLAPAGDGSLPVTEARRPQLTLSNVSTSETTSFAPPPTIPVGAENELAAYLAKHGIR